MTKPLNKAFNIAVNHITNRIFPTGFDTGDCAPQTYEDLQRHYKKTRRVLVWTGGSDQTIFADPETNFAFRAWHDSKHILFELAFDLCGEVLALHEMKKDIWALFGHGDKAKTFCKILDAEIFGQLCYQRKRGGFPLDQMGFIQDYLANGRIAIYGNYGVSLEAA